MPINAPALAMNAIQCGLARLDEERSRMLSIFDRREQRILWLLGRMEVREVQLVRLLNRLDRGESDFQVFCDARAIVSSGIEYAMAATATSFQVPEKQG